MRARATALLVALLGSATACGADLGALGGLEARTGHFVATGRLAAATKLGTPLNDEGLLVGVSLQPRAEANVGSRWDGGFMLGWGAGPAKLDGRLGFEAYGEFGTPLHAMLFQRGSLYAGLVLALPIHFGSPRRVVDLNESTWILTRRIELAPLLQARFHRDPRSGRTALWRSDLSLGLVFRFRGFSDLF